MNKLNKDGRRGSRGHRGPRVQRGAYAVEFALVFPVFFVVFYAVLSFGMIFTVQQSLTLAAEEGARATLQYPALPAAASNTLMRQFQGRLQRGCQVATNVSNWLSSTNNAATPTCVGTIIGPCVDANGAIQPGTSCSVALGDATAASPVACGYDTSEQCRATLTISYAYGSNPLIPSLPGTTLIAPSVLAAQAVVTLDPGALQLAENDEGGHS